MLSVKGRVQQQTTQQNIINQTVQFAACGDSTSTPDQLVVPDKTWKTYTFLPSVVNGSPTNSFGKFSFQYPTTYDNGNIKDIHLATTPQDFVGIITDSQNVQYFRLGRCLCEYFCHQRSKPEDNFVRKGFSGRIYEIKDFKTNSGITGKEMVLKMENRSACWGYDIRAKIAFMLPQNKSGGKPAVIVFDTKWNNAYQNSLVESVAKTFAETNSGNAVTISLFPALHWPTFLFCN